MDRKGNLAETPFHTDEDFITLTFIFARGAYDNGHVESFYVF